MYRIFFIVTKEIATSIGEWRAVQEEMFTILISQTPPKKATQTAEAVSMAITLLVS